MADVIWLRLNRIEQCKISVYCNLKHLFWFRDLLMLPTGTVWTPLVDDKQNIFLSGLVII